VKEKYFYRWFKIKSFIGVKQESDRKNDNFIKDYNRLIFNIKYLIFLVFYESKGFYF